MAFGRAYPHAPVVRVLLDNLSTHSAGALNDTFPQQKRERCSSGSSSIRPPSTPVGTQYGRNRNRRPAQPVPRPPYRQMRTPSSPRSQHGKPAATLTRQNQLDFYCRKGSRQTTQSLRTTMITSSCDVSRRAPGQFLLANVMQMNYKKRACQGVRPCPQTP